MFVIVNAGSADWNACSRVAKSENAAGSGVAAGGESEMACWRRVAAWAAYAVGGSRSCVFCARKRVIVDPDGKNAKQEVFASGWITGAQDYAGRPTDILQAKDGSLLVADDWAGAIYRISYQK